MRRTAEHHPIEVKTAALSFRGRRYLGRMHVPPFLFGGQSTAVTAWIGRPEAASEGLDISWLPR
jgi:hypothetical protein